MNKSEQENNSEDHSNVFELKANMLAAYPEYNDGKTFKKAKWKARTMAAFLEDIPINKEDLVQDYLAKIWEKRGEFDPSQGTRGGFAGGIIEGMAKNDYRAIKRRHWREGLSTDEPIHGGKEDSRPLTHADCYSEDSDLLPANYRGARRIRTTTDLHWIRKVMPKEDWTIFLLRWKYGTSNADLARVLGWTENKLRWHIRDYEKCYSKLLGVKRTR